ncbi:YncE family protein [Crocinitomix catalasitica]|uniref:YncE family protein n=1 Tax=Crocinitomix catalasitica TaxID=184607 RepID=UPI000484135A|nr:DUF5074 domain-containing protein [Crocinitomix catalasitica]
MKNVIVIIFALLVVASCKKKPIEPISLGEYENGLLVLNEGLFEQNNASISFYNSNDNMSYHQAFKAANDRGLGDTANDFAVFSQDGVEYIIIAVDISSQLEIVERYSLKSVAQIPLFSGGIAREPRRIEIYNNKAYVCNFDGTVVIVNLNTFQIDKIITVGSNPDGIARIGNQLFVTNSGGLNFPNYDSTISVINLTSQVVESTFKTRINCTKILNDNQGELYVVSNGDYEDVAPALLRVDPISETVLERFDLPIGGIDFADDIIYFYHQVDQKIYRLNTLTEEVDYTPIIDLSAYATFGGIEVDPINNSIYCFDVNGYVNSSIVHVYDLKGVHQYEFTSGLIAKNIIKN